MSIPQSLLEYYGLSKEAENKTTSAILKALGLLALLGVSVNAMTNVPNKRKKLDDRNSQLANALLSGSPKPLNKIDPVMLNALLARVKNPVVLNVGGTPAASVPYSSLNQIPPELLSITMGKSGLM